MAKKRTSASNIAVWVILGLLIVGLMGFGTTQFGSSADTVATVGDRELSVNRYARDMNAELNAFSQRTGAQITMQQAVAFGLDRAFLGNILNNIALENEADRLGLSVEDEVVRDALLELPIFQGLDGTFDREGYRFALERNNLSESEFERDLRYELSRGIVSLAVSAGAEMPRAFADLLLGHALETRDFTWTVLTADDLQTPIADPTEDDLRAYWEQNEADFMLPETRQITYAWLTPEMLTGTIEGDDALLEELYRARESDYNLPERRLVERLVFSSQEAADDARARLDAGEVTFEDLAAERDLDLADIDLGDVSQARLGGEAGEAVFALEGPGIAGPVQTDLGPALFRVNGIIAAQSTSFEEAREELLGEFRTEQARREIGERIDAVEDLLAGGATLEELAAETAMELGEIAWAEGSTEGPAAYAEFRQAALAAKVGDFPEVLEAADGMIFALRLNEVQPPRVEPFEDARFNVEADWRRQKTVEALAAQARTIAEDMPAAAAPNAVGEDEEVEDAAGGSSANASADDGSDASPEDTTTGTDTAAEDTGAAADATDEDTADAGQGALSEDDATTPPEDDTAADETGETPAAEDTATADGEATGDDLADDDTAPATDTGEPVAAAPERDTGPVFTTETGRRRSDVIAETPDDFMATVFRIQPGEVQVIEGTTAVYVVRVDRVTPPDLSSDTVNAQATILLRQAAQGYAQDVRAAFASAIQSEAGITINQPVLNAVQAQYGQ